MTDNVMIEAFRGDGLEETTLSRRGREKKRLKGERKEYRSLPSEAFFFLMDKLNDRLK